MFKNIENLLFLTQNWLTRLRSVLSVLHHRYFQHVFDQKSKKVRGSVPISQSKSTNNGEMKAIARSWYKRLMWIRNSMAKSWRRLAREGRRNGRIASLRQRQWEMRNRLRCVKDITYSAVLAILTGKIDSRWKKLHINETLRKISVQSLSDFLLRRCRRSNNNMKMAGWFKTASEIAGWAYWTLICKLSKNLCHG